LIILTAALVLGLQDVPNEPAKAPGLAAVRRAGQEAPQEEPKDPRVPPEKPPKPPPEPARFRAGLEAGYNSNIIRLGEEEIEEVDSGTRPDKYRVDRPDDFIWSPWFEAAMRLEGGELAGVRVWYHAFQHHSFASHPQLDGFLQLGVFEVEYRFEHEIYKREYRNLDTDAFESAFYDEHRLDASLRLRPSDAVRVTPAAGLGAEDYESPFNHRDALLFRLGVEAEARTTEWLRLSLEYGFELQNAFASSSQPDTSYQQNGIEAKARASASKSLDFVVAWRIAFRDYTTDNDPAVDPSHRDRSDDRRRWRLQAVWKASPAVVLEVEARFTDVDSDKPNTNDSPEETDWSREEYVVGVRITF
jgi:hypothetical protein